MASMDKKTNEQKRFEEVREFVRAVAKKPGLTKKQLERLMQDHDIKDVDEASDAAGTTPLMVLSAVGKAAAVKALTMTLPSPTIVDSDAS